MTVVDSETHENKIYYLTIFTIFVIYPCKSISETLETVNLNGKI